MKTKPATPSAPDAAKQSNPKPGPNAAYEGNADENASKTPFAPEHDARTGSDRDGNASHERSPKTGPDQKRIAPAKPSQKQS